MPGWGNAQEMCIVRQQNNKPGEPYGLNDIVQTGGLEASAYVAAPYLASTGVICQVYCRNLGPSPLTVPYANVAIELGGPIYSNQVMLHYDVGIGKFVSDSTLRLDCVGNAAFRQGLVLPALVANSFASDAAAASGGIAVGGLYNNAGQVQVRLV